MFSAKGVVIVNTMPRALLNQPTTRLLILRLAFCTQVALDRRFAVNRPACRTLLALGSAALGGEEPFAALRTTLAVRALFSEIPGCT